MKHMGQESLAQFRSLLGEAGLLIDEDQQWMLLHYLDGILTANEQVNLTRVIEPYSAIRLHLVDSLIALPEVLEALSGDMIDLGSGGGFPGVPLGVAARRRTDLLDSVTKKGAAVAKVLNDVLPDREVGVVSGRAENHALTHPEEYSVVVARAVAPLAVLAELASPLLRLGGVLIALKGDPTPEELISGARAARIVGLGQFNVRKTTLPAGGEQRTILTATKERSSSVPLPRRDGVAQKSPLG